MDRPPARGDNSTVSPLAASASSGWERVGPEPGRNGYARRVSEAVSWWLRTGEGSEGAGIARRITPGGLLIGRAPQSDVVVPSERVSRRQALVYLAATGPRLEVLGRAPTRVDGDAVSRSAELAAGARIELGDLLLEVVREDQGPSERDRAPVWVLEGPSGGLFGMAHSPFLVGGSVEDDLRVEGWPPSALVFRFHGHGALEVEAEVEVEVDGRHHEPGSVPLRRGATVGLRGARVRVVTGGVFGSESTAAVEAATPAVRAARLEFMPRGGRLTLELQGGERRTLYLSDRRCDLVALLLQPPEPQRAGDFLDDELVITRVWGKQLAGRTNLNVLIHRVRKDLARVGLDGAALLQRSEGGGATRLALGEGVAIVVS